LDVKKGKSGARGSSAHASANQARIKSQHVKPIQHLGDFANTAQRLEIGNAFGFADASVIFLIIRRMLEQLAESDLRLNKS
jgi:hypothetical protein